MSQDGTEPGEPTEASLRTEFPGWDFWPDPVNQLKHARLKGATPPVLVRGEDWQHVRDQVSYKDAHRG